MKADEKQRTEYEQELDATLKHFDAFGVNERGEIERIVRKFYDMGCKHGLSKQVC